MILWILPLVIEPAFSVIFIFWNLNFRDNFLDVDFYFEEMSVEKIIQGPAYDEESLFGKLPMSFMLTCLLSALSVKVF